MKKSPNSELEKHSNTIPLKKRNENQRKTKKRTNNYKSLMKKKPLSINPWKILTKINQKIKKSPKFPSKTNTPKNKPNPPINKKPKTQQTTNKKPQKKPPKEKKTKKQNSNPTKKRTSVCLTFLAASSPLRHHPGPMSKKKNPRRRPREKTTDRNQGGRA